MKSTSVRKKDPNKSFGYYYQWVCHDLRDNPDIAWDDPVETLASCPALLDILYQEFQRRQLPALVARRIHRLFRDLPDDAFMSF